MNNSREIYFAWSTINAADLDGIISARTVGQSVEKALACRLPLQFQDYHIDAPTHDTVKRINADTTRVNCSMQNSMDMYEFVVSNCMVREADTACKPSLCLST